MPPHIGQPVVAWSTLILVLILILGIVIWIQKNRKAIKNRIWFRWQKGTKWPRMNFDLHVVGGLYVTVFALIFAITGLVWGIQWYKDAQFADKLLRMNYEIHTGAILGLSGKIFAFLMSLFIASLPLSGCILW